MSAKHIRVNHVAYLPGDTTPLGGSFEITQLNKRCGEYAAYHPTRAMAAALVYEVTGVKKLLEQSGDYAFDANALEIIYASNGVIRYELAGIDIDDPAAPASIALVVDMMTIAIEAVLTDYFSDHSEVYVEIRRSVLVGS